MSAPEPTPFAVYVGHTEDDGHKTLIGGVPIYFGMELSARRAVDTSNAAVQRERQAAFARGAEAMRDLSVKLINDTLYSRRDKTVMNGQLKALPLPEYRDHA